MEVDSARAFTMLAWTDRASYRAGDMVQLSAELRSLSPTETVMCTGGTPQPQIEWRIVNRSGHAVADSSHVGYRASLIQLRFAPHGRILWKSPVDWDLQYWNRRRDDIDGAARDVVGLPVRGPSVPPGPYRLEVQWHATPWHDDRSEVPPVLHAASSDVFMIEPES